MTSALAAPADADAGRAGIDRTGTDVVRATMLLWQPLLDAEISR